MSLRAEEKPLFSSIETKMEMGVSAIDFIKERSDFDINDYPAIDGEFTLTLDNEKNFKIQLSPRIKIDFQDSSRNRYIPNNAYFLWYGKTSEIYGGLKTINWGVSNFFNPTNLLNRKDLETNLYDPPSLGEVVIGGKKSISKAGPFDNLTLEGMVFPFFQETPLAENGSRFGINGGVSGFSVLKDSVQDTPDTYIDQIAFAARISATYRWLDWSINYYHGPERNPPVQLVINSNGDIVLRPFYYTIDMVGLNMAGSVGSFLLHFEASVKMTGTNDFRSHLLPGLTENIIPSTYAQFVPGVDYTIDGFLKGPGTLILTMEYYTETKQDEILEGMRPLKNDLFLGARYGFNNVRFSELQLGILKDLGNREMLAVAEFNSFVYKDLKLSVQAIGIFQDNNRDLFFSFFPNNSYGMVRLSYAWGKKW